jgi:nucleotide-binding universal stress UspA family protein
MASPRRILVPVDLTPASEDLVRYGIAWADQFGSELHVLHVVADLAQQAWSPDVAGLDLAAMTDAWVSDATYALSTLIDALPISPERVRTAVAIGRPATSIEAYAAQHGIDLIILASRPHNFVARTMLSTLTEVVVRNATCPVLTIGGELKMPRWLGGVRTILVPIDLDDTATATLAYARELAMRLDAALRVVHVVAPPWERQLTYLPPAGVVKAVEELTGTIPEHTVFNADAAWDVQSTIRIGDPGDRIMACAEELGADLIVMATHGRNTLARLVLGSVAQKVMRHAHCPVLTLNAHVCDRLHEGPAVVAETEATLVTPLEVAP